MDEVVRVPAVAKLTATYGHDIVVDAARVLLARMRQEITTELLKTVRSTLALYGLPQAVEEQLRRSLAHSLRPVINATGVILHTNLGRAP